MVEFSGRLSERVRFEARGDARGGAGELSGDWVVRFARWASVEPLARADPTAFSADTRHSARRWKVTIRAGLLPTLDMRMLWRGEILAPTGIEQDPAEPGQIVIWAEDASG